MSYRHVFGALIVTAVLLTGLAGTATAHSWQNEVGVGDFELGVSSSPETPVAGMVTEFSGRIADNQVAEGDANRLSWGGVVNTTLEVHIRGPDGYHDHVETSVPVDDAHFHFSYLFPAGGEYSIAIVGEFEGEEYAFQFTRDVMLLPSNAQGESIEAIAGDVSHVHEEVESTNAELASTNEKVDALQTQLDAIEAQLADHDAAVESGDEVAVAEAPGFTMAIAIAALVAVLAYAVGRRRG